jgi:hypothetical protein
VIEMTDTNTTLPWVQWNVTDEHDRMADLFRGLGGVEMTTGQIKRFVQAHLGDVADVQWMQPTDHCIDHTNKAPCQCAGTDRAIFEYLERGRFRVRDVQA